MKEYKIIKQSTCEKCNGNGVWANPAWVDYNEANPVKLGEIETMQWFLERDLIVPKFALGDNQEVAITFNFPDSELSCNVCGGRGWVEAEVASASDLVKLAELILSEKFIEDKAQSELDAERQAEADAYSQAESEHYYGYFQQEMLAEFAELEHLVTA